MPPISKEKNQKIKSGVGAQRKSSVKKGGVTTHNIKTRCLITKKKGGVTITIMATYFDVTLHQ
jgi:hypothetical protein